MMGNLEDAALFLETCILNIEILTMDKNFHSPSWKQKLLDMELLMRVQLCALLSQINRHQEALFHGQIDVRICHFLIDDLVAFCLPLIQDDRQ